MPWFTMCRLVQSVFRNKVPLVAPKKMAHESDLLGFNWLGKGNSFLSIMEYLVANMISTRNTKYDSKAKRMEEIKLTTKAGC